MEGKKGDLTAKQLITIIILILSFVVIIAFFFLLNLKDTIDKESCRNSVLLRGSLPGGKDIVSLECKTQDICLSMGDDCEISRKDMTTIKVRSEDELVGEMVNILYDCWWMMGEGKIDYISAGIGFDETYCSICSEIYFDEKIKQRYGEGIKYEKLYDYMKQTKIPGKDESYLFYMFQLNSLDSVRNGLLASDWPIDIYEYKIMPSKEYVAVTATMKPTSSWEIVGAVVGGVIGGVVGFYVPPSSYFTVPAGIAAGGAAGVWIGPADIKYLIPQYIPFEGEELENLNCKEFVTKI